MVRSHRPPRSSLRRRHVQPVAEGAWLESDGEELDVSCLEAVPGPRILALLLSSQHTLLLALLAFRTLNALLIQTAFVPDEFWQSLEVAHKMVFGYGYETWEWRAGLRGYSYPALFAVLYKLLHVLHLDFRVLLIKLPRLLQAVFAALSDLYLYKLSVKLRGVSVGRWALLCQLTSWFTFYCAPRTLTNSMETALTTIALYYYPWPHTPRKAQWKYMLVAGLSIVVRPTAAVLWLPLFLFHLHHHRHVAFSVARLMAEIGFLVFAGSSVIDRLCYGRWVNVQYNFLRFNVLSGLAGTYGTHPWHWYLSQGLPAVLGVQAVPAVLAACKGMDKPLVALITWTTFVYSCLGHKEFRFVLPLVSLSMHLAAHYLAVLAGHTHYNPHHHDDDDDEEDADHTDPAPVESAARGLPCSVGRLCVVVLVVVNLPVALYTSLIHQRGTVDVMTVLHSEARLQTRLNLTMSVSQLMPCHSTPHYSYLHHNISLRFLTCEPNLDGVSDYVDEADIFYQDPPLWLNTTYSAHPDHARDHSGDHSGDHSMDHLQDHSLDQPPYGALPTHIVCFNSLLPAIGDFLNSHHYSECARLFHTHSPEGRVGSHVVVMCHESWQAAKQILKRPRLNVT